MSIQFFNNWGQRDEFVALEIKTQRFHDPEQFMFTVGILGLGVVFIKNV